VSRPEFVSRRLRADDDLDGFRGSRPELDEWLRQSARHAEAMRSGRTWVWTQSGHVVAYYTLAGHVLERDRLSGKLGRGSPDRIPAVIIAKLALAKELQGRGLGGVLLADASQRILVATDIVAARFVVVDAVDDEAASFYEHFGYRRIAGANRLVRKVGDLAVDFGNE
jgi:GNAT superfamily N-acetyltransferase